LCHCWRRLGVPFKVPRGLGAVGIPFGRHLLPSVGWCTGQSGAPPDMNSACPVPDLLPFLVKPTVALQTSWRTGHCRVHTGQSGAPTDRWLRPRVARWLRCRPLAWALLAHRTVRRILASAPQSIPESGEFTSRASGAPDTVRCTRSKCSTGFSAGLPLLFWI
jgi:hypothetical protein